MDVASLSCMQTHPRLSLQVHRHETKPRTGSLDTMVNYPTDKYRKMLLTCRPVIHYIKQGNNGPSNCNKEWATLFVLTFVPPHYTGSDTHTEIINGRVLSKVMVGIGLVGISAVRG